MAAGITYSPIATTTESGSTSTYTFSSIPSTYTDLRLVILVGASTSSNTYNMRVNGDTGTNYSMTELYGDGTSDASDRRTSATSFVIVGSRLGAPTTITNTSFVDLMNYSNATTYKTILDRSGSTLGTVASVGLWRFTSAINSITILANGAGNFAAGSTFTLYGIAAA